jgi:VWFA-related protein
MFLIHRPSCLTVSRVNPCLRFLALALAGFLWLGAQPGYAQNQQTQPSPTPTPTPASNAPAEAGGPQGDIGPIAVPKKKEEPPKKEDVPKGPKKVEGLDNFSMRVASQLVTLDVGVLSKDGTFIPNLKKEYFRVLEDGVPQKISSFTQTEAPITAVMLVEFANNQYFYNFEYDSINTSAVFATTLKKNDWVALISYDIRPHMLADFTQDKNEIYNGLRSLQFAMSSETNLFDALYDTIDRLEGVEGRKYIILVSSGRDTFSKHTLDQTLKKVQAAKDIVIYAVGTGQALREYLESHRATGALCDITSMSCRMEYLQADNQMRSFAKMTGGQAFFPIFQGQLREVFGEVAQAVRNQYSIAYHPTNTAQDGSFRKIKVELVDETGHPLRMKDQKGKDVKYQVVARDGYRAKQQVE